MVVVLLSHYFYYQQMYFLRLSIISLSTMIEQTPQKSKRQVKEQRLASFLETLLASNQYSQSPEDRARLIPLIIRKQTSALENYLCHEEITQIYQDIQKQDEFKGFFTQIDNMRELSIEGKAQNIAETLKIKSKFRQQLIKIIVSQDYSQELTILNALQKVTYYELLHQYGLLQRVQRVPMDRSPALQQSRPLAESVISNTIEVEQPMTSIQSSNCYGTFDAIIRRFEIQTTGTEGNTLLFLRYIVQLFTNSAPSRDEIASSWETLSPYQKIVEFGKLKQLQINNVSHSLMSEVRRVIGLCELNLYYTLKTRISQSPERTKFGPTLQQLESRINQLTSKQEFIKRMEVCPRRLVLEQMQNGGRANNKIEFLKEYIYGKQHEYYNIFKLLPFKCYYNHAETDFKATREDLRKKLQEITNNRVQHLILFYQIETEEYQPFDVSNGDVECSKIKIRSREKEQVMVNYKEIRLSVDYSKDFTIKEMTQFIIFQINQKLKDIISPSNSRFKFVFRKQLDRVLTMEESICTIESQYGDIVSVQVELQSLVNLYYKGDEYQFWQWQAEPISILKQKIKEALQIPVESQILQYQIGSKTVELETKNVLSKMGVFDKQIDVSLLVKVNLQFYGFHSNIQLRYDSFKQFFIENHKQRNQYLQACKLKEDEEEWFFHKAIPYIFSSIKKRLDLESVIIMFREEVSQYTKQSIWTSSREINTFNPTFLLYYILYNSDDRLRVEIMNLVKHQYPLPIYFKQFSMITNISNEWLVNQDLVWILNNEANIVSIGLHNEDEKSESGKSQLLNKIFYTNFIKNSSKHSIVSGCPEISLRIYQNTYPVNLIDISKKTPANISDSLLKVANFVVLHSWRSEKQTQEEIQRIKSICNKNVYVLTVMRDVRMDSKDNWLVIDKELMNNTIEIFNLSASLDPITIQMILKQIKKIVHTKVEEVLKPLFAQPRKPLDNEFQLFTNPLFDDFERTLARLFSIITDFRPATKKYKEFQNKFLRTGMFETKLKESIDKFKIHPLIQEIVLFISKNVRHSNTLMERLREKVKSYRQEFQHKYKVLIHAKKDFDRLFSEDLEQYKQKLQYYAQIISDLPLIKPFSTATRVDVLKGLSEAIEYYQDHIKPQLISIELLWRQFYLMVKINPQYTIGDQLLIDFIVNMQKKQIFNGQPFQLLDGDSLRMPKKIIKKIFESVKGTAATVIILGPQSSGKSTLLNYLFGCDFKTSQGRCTRGVYGTYYNISNSSMFSCKSIFLIDTEGLLAITSKKDQQVRADFDSKLILFCLAVSDFVIVNTKSDLDSETIGKLKACKQRLPTLSQNSNPEFWLVMNQSQTSDMSNKANDVNRLQGLFDLGNSRCLSQAFDTKVLSSEQICILGQDILTKKKSRNDFQRMTLKLQTDLMQRMSMKSYRGIPEIIDKMEMIWSTIEKYPDLGKNVDKQIKQIDLEINEWKQKNAEELNNTKDQLLNQFKDHDKNTQQIETLFMEKVKTLEQGFLKRFSANNPKPSVRDRIQFQKKIISSQFQYILQMLKHGIEEEKIKKKALVEEQEGNIDIRIQINKVKAEQLKKKMTMDQKSKRFQKAFSKVTQKMESSLDEQNLVHNLFGRVQQYYSSRIKQYSSASTCFDQIILPKFTLQPDVKCSYEQYKQKVLRQFHNQTNINMIIQSSTRPHTNVLAGGKTDASLKYFNMKDYFQTRQQTVYTTLTLHHLEDAFKSQSFYNEVRRDFKNQKESCENTIISEIVKQINNCLSSYGIKFTNPKKVSYFIQEGLNELQQECKKSWVKKQLEQLLSKLSSFFTSNQEQNLRVQEVETHKPCSSMYINESKLKNLVHSPKFKTLNKTLLSYLSSAIIKNVIDFPLIYQQIQSNRKISKIKQKCIEKFSEQMKRQFRWFGVEIDALSYVQRILDISENRDHNCICIQTQITDWKKYESSQQFESKLGESKWFKHKQIIQQLREKKSPNKEQVQLIETQRQLLIPKKHQRQSQIIGYLGEENREVIHYLQKQETKMFLWEQLHSRGSFTLLFSEIDRIIHQSTSKHSSLPRIVQEIFSGVIKQIQIFNDDISQLSKKLTFNFQGICHMLAIFMTWKSISTREQQKLRKPVEQWIAQRQKQYNYFINMTSNQTEKVCEGQVEEFLEKILSIYCSKVDKIKEKMFKNQIKLFKQKMTRKQIQKQADEEIFKMGGQKKKMIAYIENPEKILKQQFDKAVQKSVNNLHNEINKQKYHINLYNSITSQISETLQKIKGVYKIQENQGQFSSFFRISSKKQKNLSLIDGSLDQHSSVIFMKYFLHSLLNKKQQHYDCQVFRADIKEDKKQFAFKTTFSKEAKEYFEVIQKYQLSMTNIVFFLTKLQEKLIPVQKELQSKMSFKPQEIQQSFSDVVEMSICPQKCPCCQRICGLKGSHNGPHQCLYGHQVRAFAGTMLENGDASTFRCQDMTDTSKLKHNGRVMSWKQFTDQQITRGWSFDDLAQKHQVYQNQFRYAWKTVGPHFCTKNGMKFVQFNNAADYLSNDSIHFIITLDESGSMSKSTKWPEVIKTLNQILPTIKTIPNYQQNVKISILLLSGVCKVHQQSQTPDNTNFNNIVPVWGNTAFGPTFKKAYELMDKYHTDSNIMFILLTDGEAEFPVNEVNLIKKLQHSSKNKIYYSGIEFQTTGKVMHQINQELDGKNYNASTQQELLRAFTSVVEIIKTK